MGANKKGRTVMSVLSLILAMMLLRVVNSQSETRGRCKIHRVEGMHENPQDANRCFVRID